MLEELCKQIQHCSASLQRSRNKKKCWELFQTLRNNSPQHGTGCANGRKMWQCWELLANNVISVCTGYFTSTVLIFSTWHVMTRSVYCLIGTIIAQQTEFLAQFAATIMPACIGFELCMHLWILTSSLTSGTVCFHQICTCDILSPLIC